MDRVCACGRPIPPQRGPGKPRKRCTICAPPRKAVPTRPAPVVAVPDITAELATVAAVRKQLATVGREATPEGVIALGLAGLLDAGGHTASGAAALARELRVTLTAALVDARPASALDELKARRAARLSG
jgi:hypothetical protein